MSASCRAAAYGRRSQFESAQKPPFRVNQLELSDVQRVRSACRAQTLGSAWSRAQAGIGKASTMELQRVKPWSDATGAFYCADLAMSELPVFHGGTPMRLPKLTATRRRPRHCSLRPTCPRVVHRLFHSGCGHEMHAAEQARLVNPNRRNSNCGESRRVRADT